MISDDELSQREKFYGNIFGSLEEIKKRSKFLWSVEAYHEMVSLLSKEGVANPRTIIAKQPYILSLTRTRVEEKFQGLSDLGFKRPAELIERNPFVLILSLDRIRTKIKQMRDRGVADPARLITNQPTILS